MTKESLFANIEVGDEVMRDMCSIREWWKVTEVTDETFTVGLGWMFDKKTGAEIDDDLHWGPKYGRTGSFAVEVRKATN